MSYCSNLSTQPTRKRSKKDGGGGNSGDNAKGEVNLRPGGGFNTVKLKPTKVCQWHFLYSFPYYYLFQPNFTHLTTSTILFTHPHFQKFTHQFKKSLSFTQTSKIQSPLCSNLPHIYHPNPLQSFLPKLNSLKPFQIPSPTTNLQKAPQVGRVSVRPQGTVSTLPRTAHFPT